MRSIETYEPEKGAFSTYATQWIKQAIMRSINKIDKIIRRPEHLIKTTKEYQKLILQYYQNYKNYPPDEYIKEKLNINDDTLSYLKEIENFNTISIHQKAKNDDNESDELIDFISSKSNEYDKLMDKEEISEFLNVIKSSLTPKEYYILYYRVLTDDEKKTLEAISKELGVTRERIRQIEVKILKKVKPLINKDGHIYVNKLNKLKSNYGSYYKKLKVEPLTPNDIYTFLYLKDKLSEIELRILYLKIIDNYNYSLKEIQQIIGIPENEFKFINNNLNAIIKQELSNKNNFNKYKEKLIKEYGSKIYNIKLMDHEKLINYNLLKNKYFNITLEEIENIFSNSIHELTEQEKNIIYKYYGKRQNQNISTSIINREVNLAIFGYKKSPTLPDKNKLYKTLINNKNEFSEEQILFFESYIFNLIPNKKFLEKYPNSDLPRNNSFILEKLEMMYYGIHKMLENKFNDKKYLFVKENYSEKLGEERIKILDLYYGINESKKTIQEIADIYGLTYLKMHGKLRDIREFAMNLYANRNSTINIDKTLYHKYILDKRFPLTPESRKVLQLFMIENKTYDEISSVTGLTNYRISNIITELIRKMDNYRFNLLQFEDYTLEKLEQFYLQSGYIFEEIERKIIESRYIEGKENKDTAIKYNTSLNEVNKLIGNFNKKYFLFQIRNTKLSLDEITEEINKSLIESVTTEREKEYISYYYGIKNKYNINGLKLDSSEIYKKFNITKNTFYHVFSFGHDKIKGRKEGIIKPELLFIEKPELENMLKDPHLPISDKEREIIYYLFGLYNYPIKTLSELSEIYNDTESSLKRRYMRSIVSILKYKNKEIEGIINYDIDILPNLKYFSNNYRLLLEDYYKNNMTYESLSKKYELTKNQIISIFDRIKIELFEIINNPEDPKFNFDYYEKNRNNPQLPFYGDKKLADKIFRLYFGLDDIKRKSTIEIIKELNLSFETSKVNKIINNYMLAICKLKNGVITKEDFSYEEIKKHYLEKEKEMPEFIKNSYIGYFKRKEKNSYFNYRKLSINNIVLYDMLLEKYDNCFDVNKTNREEVLHILKKHYNEINSRIKDRLMYLFDISEREFMTGKEINHLYRILNKLDNQLTKNKTKVYKNDNSIT